MRKHGAPAARVGAHAVMNPWEIIDDDDAEGFEQAIKRPEPTRPGVWVTPAAAAIMPNAAALFDRVLAQAVALDADLADQRIEVRIEARTDDAWKGHAGRRTVRVYIAAGDPASERREHDGARAAACRADRARRAQPSGRSR